MQRLSTIPVAGDIAGFVLTCYAVYKAKQIGVPQAKLNRVMKFAVMDAVVGLFLLQERSLMFLFVRAVKP